MGADLNIQGANNKQKPMIFRVLLYLMVIVLYCQSCVHTDAVDMGRVLIKSAVLLQDIGRSLVKGE